MFAGLQTEQTWVTATPPVIRPLRQVAVRVALQVRRPVMDHRSVQHS